MTEGLLGRNETEYAVLFREELRYFAVTNSPRVMRMLWDGKDVYRLDGGSVTLRNLDTQTPSYFFDPRILGITTDYTWDTSIRDALQLETPKTELVGHERIDGDDAWHVKAILNSNWTADIWIDETKDFRVYQYEIAHADGTRRRTRSFYEMPDYPWIPSRIEGENYDANGNLRTKRTIELLDAEAGIKISDEVWTLAGLLRGLTLPTWTPVFDVRTRQEVGWWRDGRLGPPRPWEPEPEAPSWTPKRFGVVVLMILVLVGPALVFGFRHARRRADQRG